jgi:MFS family permease
MSPTSYLASKTDYFIYAGYVVVSAIGGLVGGRLMSKEIDDDERRRSAMNDVDSYRSYVATYRERRARLYGAIAVTWVGAVVAAVCLSGLWPSSLSKVELGPERERER